MAKAKKINEINQPFYGDVLARSLIRIGIPKYEAYEIAHQVSKSLSHKPKDRLSISRLVEAFLKKKYPNKLKAYKTWRRIMKEKKPMIILIGGGTGIGTSTLAMRLAWLLEINRIVNTDSIREVIREFVNDKVSPILHVSSFRAGQLIQEVHSDYDRLIYGFSAQCKEVLSGIEAVVQRSINENVSVVIEGVHLIPGEMDFLEKYAHKAMIIQVMLDVNQASKHHQHFLSRHKESLIRNKAKYLKYFKEIRLIRRYLVNQAKKNRVPVIQNYDLHKVEKTILKQIYSHYVRQK